MMWPFKKADDESLRESKRAVADAKKALQEERDAMMALLSKTLREEPNG